MDVSIRTAGPEDAPTVNRILTETWKAAYAGIVPQDYLDSLDVGKRNQMKEDITAGRRKVLLLFEDGVPAGTVGYGKGRDESREDWGEIIFLYLRPAFWRRGYGEKMICAALDDLARSGFQKFYLWVMAENRNARAFYRAMGFEASQDVSDYEIAGRRIADIRYVSKGVL